MDCARCICRLKLMLLIETKRKEMIDLSSIYGMNSKITIQSSQELDKILNQFYYLSYHKQSA